MNYAKIITIFITLTSQVLANQIKSDWQNLTYFERHNAKIKLQMFDPPISIEWNQIDKLSNQDLKDRLIQNRINQVYLYENFEQWYKSFEKFNTNQVVKIFGGKEKLREKFIASKKSIPTKKDYMKAYPFRRYDNIVSIIDIQYAGNLYSVLVSTYGANPLTYYPKDLDDFSKTEWYILHANILKYENGTWKNDFFPISNFPPVLTATNLETLKSLLETGYAYNSIEHEGLYPFTPPNLPVEDSLRESYPGENSFRIHEGSNFDWIGRFDASLENILAGKRFTYNVDPLQGGKPYPPGFQPKRDIRSVLDFDPPPIPGEPDPKAETTDTAVETSEPSEETNVASRLSRPPWAYFIFAWAILATLALIAVLTLRRK